MRRDWQERRRTTELHGDDYRPISTPHRSGIKTKKKKKYAAWFDFYNACQFELAEILMLENVNKHQHLLSLFTFFRIKIPANSRSPAL